MRPLFALALGTIAVAAIFSSHAAHAQGSAVYLATYIDVMPNSVASGTRLLTHYRDASRKQDGNLRFDAMQEIARSNRFVIIEAWRDKAALDAHVQVAETAQFRDKLKAIQNAPYDERINNALYIGQGSNEDRAGAIYVATHVDVIPPGKDATMAALKEMSDDTAKDPGNITYEVLQQANRANHFTVVEEWTTMRAIDAHAMAAHTRAFREKLVPVAGALYDERFYKTLK